MGAAAATKWAAVGCRRWAGRMSSQVGVVGWVVGSRVGVCTLVWAAPVRIWSIRSVPRVLLDHPRGPITAVQHVLSR